MINEHPVFSSVKEDLNIIRYLDWDKFESLIQQKALYFPNIESFLATDKSEAEIVSPLYNDIMDTFGDTFYKYLKSIKAITFNGFQLSGNKIYDLYNIREMVLRTYNLHKRFIFANCWSINEYESYTMWKSYTKTPESVAICSTISNLKSGITDTKNIICNRISYTSPTAIKHDFRKNKQHGDFILFFRGGLRTVLLKMLYYKKIEYQDERELRLTYSDDNTLPSNIVYGELIRNDIDYGQYQANSHVLIEINPCIIITKIILHPKSDSGFRLRVTNLLHQNNYSELVGRIRHSSLYQ